MKIGVFGASSQVGASIAIYLKILEGIDVDCFIRSNYSKYLFDICEIKSNIFDYKELENHTYNLFDYDIIVDCTYPADQTFNILPIIEKNIGIVIKSMRPNSIYIYLSSIMAYGMPTDSLFVDNYRIPQNSYSYIKRKSEKIVYNLAKKYKIIAYNFRLGQVHGFLQSVNTSFRQKMSVNQVGYVEGKKQDLTNTVFISSITKAILKCYFDKLDVGLYTIVSSPQWTLEELYNFYIKYYDLNIKIHYKENEIKIKQSKLKSMFINMLLKHRDLLETYILIYFPIISLKLKGKYRMIKTAKALFSKNNFETLHKNLLGIPDIRILTDVDSSFSSIFINEKKTEKIYYEILEKVRK